MMLRWTHETDFGALYVRRSDEPIIESEQVEPGIVLDYDATGRVVSIEVLCADKNDRTPLKQAA